MILLLLACAAPPTPPAPPPVPPALAGLIGREQAANIAHRGGALLGPEETIETLRVSLDAGAEVLELDLHGTSDGHVVTLHDSTLDRTTDGAGEVSAHTRAEVQALDAGARWTRDGQTWPFRGQGRRVPTLAEVLATFPTTPLVLEIKQSEPPIVEAVAADLRAADALGRVIVCAVDTEVIAAFRALVPEVATGLSMGEVADFYFVDDDEEADYHPPGRFLQVPPGYGGLDLLTPERVARARRLGLGVQVWTINDPAAMETWRGLDGIMTDDPVSLQGILRPPATP